MMNNTTIQTGTQITDGYFVYTVISDSNDGWVTATLCGHTFRLQKSQITLN
jgi:hypothetical protein